MLKYDASFQHPDLLCVPPGHAGSAGRSDPNHARPSRTHRGEGHRAGPHCFTSTTGRCCATSLAGHHQISIRPPASRCLSGKYETMQFNANQNYLYWHSCIHGKFPKLRKKRSNFNYFISLRRETAANRTTWPPSFSSWLTSSRLPNSLTSPETRIPITLTPLQIRPLPARPISETMHPRAGTRAKGSSGTGLETWVSCHAPKGKRNLKDRILDSLGFFPKSPARN